MSFGLYAYRDGNEKRREWDDVAILRVRHDGSLGWEPRRSQAVGDIRATQLQVTVRLKGLMTILISMELDSQTLLVGTMRLLASKYYIPLVFRASAASMSLLSISGHFLQLAMQYGLMIMSQIYSIGSIDMVSPFSLIASHYYSTSLSSLFVQIIMFCRSYANRWKQSQIVVHYSERHPHIIPIHE